MYASIQKWGNSNAVRLPKAILDKMRLRENDQLEIIERDHQIILQAAKRKYTSLDELFAGYDGTYLCEEADPGAAGKEVL